MLLVAFHGVHTRTSIPELSSTMGPRHERAVENAVNIPLFASPQCARNHWISQHFNGQHVKNQGVHVGKGLCDRTSQVATNSLSAIKRNLSIDQINVSGSSTTSSNSRYSSSIAALMEFP